MHPHPNYLCEQEIELHGKMVWGKQQTRSSLKGKLLGWRDLLKCCLVNDNLVACLVSGPPC